MYIRVLRAAYNPANEEAFLRLASERIDPTYQGLPGYQSSVSGLDRAAGRLVGITTWDTEEHAQAVGSAPGIRDLVAPCVALGVVFDSPPEIYRSVE